MTNEARDIKALPTNVSKMWKDIKQTNVIRFRGQVLPPKIESVYMATQQEKAARNKNQKNGKGGGNANTKSTPPAAQQPPLSPRSGHYKPPPNLKLPYTPHPPREIVCFNCNEAGHRSTVCPHPHNPHNARVHFTDSTDVQIFLSSVTQFDPALEDDFPQSSVYLSKTSLSSPTTLLLDTQASIHIVCNPDLLPSIQESVDPIFVQGITRDRIRVHQEGILHDLGVSSYFSPSTAANILSYSMLQSTHHCSYDNRNDSFTAVPLIMGPTLLFKNVKGHYTLDILNIVSCYLSSAAYSSYT